MGLLKFSFFSVPKTLYKKKRIPNQPHGFGSGDIIRIHRSEIRIVENAQSVFGSGIQIANILDRYSVPALSTCSSEILSRLLNS